MLVKDISEKYFFLVNKIIFGTNAFLMLLI